MDFKATIKGKEYPLLFDILALSDFSKEKGITELSKLDQVFASFSNGEEGASIDQLQDLAKLTLYGIKSGCEDEGIECNLTDRQVFRWLFAKGENNIETVMAAIKGFTQSISGEVLGEAHPQAHQKA